MRKFSWYTIPVKLTDLSTVYQYAVDRYIPLEVDRHGFGSYIHVKAGTFVTRHVAVLSYCSGLFAFPAHTFSPEESSVLRAQKIYCDMVRKLEGKK